MHGGLRSIVGENNERARTVMKKQAVWTYILEACFVCPSVFDDMQLKATRGFCDAYVMTHEGGHHAQTCPAIHGTSMD